METLEPETDELLSLACGLVSHLLRVSLPWRGFGDSSSWSDDMVFDSKARGCTPGRHA